uniref:GED domain-containing protein n=1 Tax=Heterorhabditis bacteriophora TaxID=37862 RepID=A0A1I7X527_HETBA
MIMDRPVIVNSLLCFIHNFRGNPRVRSLVEEYFSKTAIAEARSLLSEKIVSSEVVAIPEDVFELYDLLVTKGDSLQFAATDLTNLPLALLSNDEDRNEILRELKTLRTFISDALDGRIEDGPSA